MTNNEYQQLVEFLGRKFAEIDQRFTAIDHRFTGIEQQLRDILGHFDEVYRRVERLEPRALQARIDELEQQLRP